MSEPGWTPQYLPGGSGDSERGRRQSADLNPDDVAIKAFIAVTLVFTVWMMGLLWPAAYPLEVALGGAVAGVGTGLMAVGLVLIYRTTRIINFAYGAMGGFCAMLAVALSEGQMDVDLPGLRFTVGNFPWLLALMIGIACGVGAGALVERLVIRHFVRSPRLVLTVATIGLAQIFAGAMYFLPQWFELPAAPTRFDTPLSSISINFGERVFDGNQFLLLAAVPVLLGGLIWFLHMTEVGVAVRGMAENMDRARLLGIPVNQLSLLLWAVTGGLVAATMVLSAPSQGVPFELAAGPSLLVAPLAAAVVAGMSSMSVAFIAAVALGAADQLARLHLSGEFPWVLYLVVIVVALLVQRRSTSRAALADESSWTMAGVATTLPRQLASLPEVRAARLISWVLLAAALAYIPLRGSPSEIHQATIALTFALAALSLVILTGWGGVVSLGQFALVGVGGVTAAHLIATRNTDLFLVIGASAVAGGVIALAIGLPALRVVGQYLAVTTLTFAVVMEQYVVKPQTHTRYFHDRFERPELWGRFELADERVLYLLALALVVLSAAAIVNLRRARAGRTIAAARDNERGAAAVGVNGVEARLAVFVLAGVFAGAAGAVHAVMLSSVGEGSYPAINSLLLFSMAVIGGISSVGGTLAGVALVSWLGHVLPGEQYRILLTGVGLLLILMVVPGGLRQVYDQLRGRFAQWAARRRGVVLVDELETVEEPLAAASGMDDLTPAPAPSASLSRPRAGPSSPGGAYAAPSYAPKVSLLTCEGIEASYGTFQVLFGIDASVDDGEMLALLGTNGAGKSTLLRSFSGLLPADRGKVIFDGIDITKLPAEKVARRGLSLMPGGRGIFPRLTVANNLRLAGWMKRHDRRAAARARREALELFPVLKARSNQLAGDLSGGEQQQLSLAMAFVTKPKLLCIDELSLGLAPAVVGQLVDKVKEIHASGTAIIVVEQSVNVALLLCEKAVFLEKGQVRFRGPTTGLLERPDVLRAVFLGDSDASEPRRTLPPGERPSRGVALGCQALVKHFGGIRAVDDVDLEIPPASIVGLIGHNGAGKTTLFDVIAGFLPADGGRVHLDGRDITRSQPHQRAIAQLGRSFQEARLYPSLTVAETLAVAMETHLPNRDPLAAAMHLPAATMSERYCRVQVGRLIELLSLEAYRDRLVSDLSTGIRRIVELGSLLAHDPAVVLLDEPSAGVAQREAEALGPLLRDVQAETGCSLLVIEHDMSMISALCDMLVALEQGAVIATGSPSSVLKDPAVVSSYLGTDQKVVRRSALGIRHTGFGAATPWRVQSPVRSERPPWP